MPNVKSYTGVIKACCKGGRVEEAVVWLQTMADQGIKPDAAAYNRITGAWAKNGKVGEATRWLETLRDLGVSPDDRTYNSVVAACARGGDTARAVQWLQAMQEQGAQTSTRTFMLVVEACARSGQVDEAVKWLQVVEDQHVELHAITYNHVINACAEVGQVGGAVRCLESMVEHGVVPDVVSYTGVIKAASRATPSADVQVCRQILDAMVATGTAVNSFTLVALFTCCARARPPAAALAADWFRRHVPGAHLNEFVESSFAMAVGAFRSGQLVKWAFREHPACRDPPTCAEQAASAAEVSPSMASRMGHRGATGGNRPGNRACLGGGTKAYDRPLEDIAQASARAVCAHFQNGGACRFGDRCRYLHEPGAASLGGGGGGGRDAEAGEGRQLCSYFQNGGACRFGDRCRYLHVDGSTARHPTLPSRWDCALDERSSGWSPAQKPCSAFRRNGHCRFGDRCHFAH